jgi:hypothetical protein
MSQTFNYIEIHGNDAVNSVVLKIVEKSDEYKNLNPTTYSKHFISSVFYGENYADFQKSGADLVTKYLHTDVIGANEFVFISGSSTPDSFQDYLTEKFATLDPHVLLVNSFNSTDDEVGQYYSVCKDAANGDYSICYAFINSESDSKSATKKKLKNLAVQIPWECKFLNSEIKK